MSMVLDASRVANGSAPAEATSSTSNITKTVASTTVTGTNTGGGLGTGGGLSTGNGSGGGLGIGGVIHERGGGGIGGSLGGGLIKIITGGIIPPSPPSPSGNTTLGQTIKIGGAITERTGRFSGGGLLTSTFRTGLGNLVGGGQIQQPPIGIIRGPVSPPILPPPRSGSSGGGIVRGHLTPLPILPPPPLSTRGPIFHNTTVRYVSPPQRMNILYRTLHREGRFNENLTNPTLPITMGQATINTENRGAIITNARNPLVENTLRPTTLALNTQRPAVVTSTAFTEINRPSAITTPATTLPAVTSKAIVTKRGTTAITGESLAEGRIGNVNEGTELTSLANPTLLTIRENIVTPTITSKTGNITTQTITSKTGNVNTISIQKAQGGLKLTNAQGNTVYIPLQQLLNTVSST